MFSKFSFAQKGRSSRGDTRSIGNGLEFENLEHRRVLATAVLEAGTMTVDLAQSDIQVILGNDGEFFTFGLDHNTDMNQRLDGAQQIRMGEVRNIHIAGHISPDTPQSLVIKDTMTLSGNLSTDGLSHFQLSGNTDILGNLEAHLLESETGLSWIGATAPGHLNIGGDLFIDVSQGNIVFDQTPMTVGGKISLINQAASGNNVLELASDAHLQNVDLRSGLRLAALDISDSPDASFVVDGRTYLKGANATLGETNLDTVDLRHLNFKFDGVFEIADDNVLELMGKNRSSEASIVTQQWLGDSGRASLIIANQANFESPRIIFGEKATDFFSVGTLSFVSEGHVHISENSSITLQGKAFARTANLIATKGIINNGDTSIGIVHQLGLQATGDIDLGRHDSDYFAPGTISFSAPNADVFLDSDTLIHLIDSKNAARNLTIKSAGQITDDAFAALAVAEDAIFEGELLTLGDGENSEFNANRVQFRVASFASLTETSDLKLFGESHAAQLELISGGDLIDDVNTNLNVQSSTLFQAQSITLAETEGDELNTGWMTFEAEGDVEIHENSGIVLGMKNRARNLKLVSSGIVEDRNNAETVVAENASFEAVEVTLGDEGDHFDSQTLSLMTQGNVTLHDAGDIMLVGETRVNTLRLRAAQSIRNMPGAIVRANFLLDVKSQQVDLGSYNDDHIASSTLNFQTDGATKLSLNRSVLLVFDSNAQSVEIVAAGDILDGYDATVHVTEFARLDGFDVILGDSNADCFSVTDGIIDVTAAGTERVYLETCL